MTFIVELKRRNVAKTAVLYVVASWLVLQVTDVLSSLLPVPDWTGALVVTLIVVGFLPAMIFSWLYELTPEGLKRENAVRQGESITHETGRKINILIIVLLVLAIGVVVVDRLIPETGTTTSTPVAERRQAPAEDSERSIAVLPFVNMSNDPDQEYFSDGISEELLNVLAQYEDLRVAARTSSFQFKGQNMDVADIAAQLHVNHVLEGSVRKAGNRIRITAQLIEADTGYHLWSETYDRELDDVFAIQDEISAAIGEALRTELALQGGAAPRVTEAANTEAYEAYMRGRQLIHLRGRQNLEEAVDELSQAVALDETYAPAHAQLAIAITLLSSSPGSYGDLTLEEVRKRATPHIERALELRPDIADAYAARTIMALANGDYESAIVNGRQALEINPSYADVINWLWLAQQALGEHSAAAKTLEHQVTVDPLSIVGTLNLASRVLYKGDLAGALEIADGLEDRNAAVGYSTRGKVLFYHGDVAESVRWSLRAYALDARDTITSTALARAFGQVGLASEGLRLPGNVHTWVYWNASMWPQLIATARSDAEKDPSSVFAKLVLADALHLSGAVSEAQPIYEDLMIAQPDVVLSDQINENNVPAARAAYGRLAAGDADGAERLADLVTQDLEERRRAWLIHGGNYRSAAIIAMVRGDPEGALELLGQAVQTGPLDPTLFSEPAFAGLHESSLFRELESEYQNVFAEERAKTLQILCYDNPAPDVWPPLPETCAGVEPR